MDRERGKSRCRLPLAALLVALSSFPVASFATCFEYGGGTKHGVEVGWHLSPELAAAAIKSIKESTFECRNYTACPAVQTSGGGADGTWQAQCLYDGVTNQEDPECNGTVVGSQDYENFSSRDAEVPCDDECEALIGQGGSFSLPINTGGGSAFTSSFCHDIGGGEGCTMEHTGNVGICLADRCYGQYSYSGDTCGGGDDVDKSTSDVNCITLNGVQACAEEGTENCGYINGDPVCVASVPPGQCIFTGDGGMACASGTGSPPAPSDGVGAPADPDGVVEIAGTPNDATVNYYNSNTVNNSSTPVEGQPNPDDGGGPGTGDLSGIEKALEDLTEPTPDSMDFGAIEDHGDALDGLGEGIVDELSDPDDWTAEGTDIVQNVLGVVPSGGCSGDLVISLPALAGQIGGSFTISCADMAVVRQYVSWAMRLLLVLSIMNMVFTRPHA